ncbi:hypothetical protein GCM10010253_41480 [Streptomyces badius]|uniref:Uncharacterized protein n=1 Tax=Streptomyces badius TaxID=1941 RepID=A0ABQ2TER3_STRBA|nr:hypothetical protein GCM10010253_41480 [Streptomyces badius]
MSWSASGCRPLQPIRIWVPNWAGVNVREEAWGVVMLGTLTAPDRGQCMRITRSREITAICRECSRSNVPRPWFRINRLTVLPEAGLG